MVKYLVPYKKNIATEMRKNGCAYSEIESSTRIPKSTLSYWLKGVKLSEPQQKKLKEKIVQIAKANSERRVLKTSRLIEEIKSSSARDASAAFQR